MPAVTLHGNSPVILAMPYVGTDMSMALVQRLADREMLYSATDRGLDRLTADLHQDLGVVRANFHWFQTDVDRQIPKGETRPKQGMLGVVPLLDRTGRTIWSVPPSMKEATSWRGMFHAPYHAAVAAQIARVRAVHRHAILITCFARLDTQMDEEAPEPVDVRLSTFMGTSCSIDLSSRLLALLRSSGQYSVALNGRILPGWSTQHYGQPAKGVHALQLELNPAAYLATGELAGHYDQQMAAPLRDLLAEAVGFLTSWRPK